MILGLSMVCIFSLSILCIGSKLTATDVRILRPCLSFEVLVRNGWTKSSKERNQSSKQANKQSTTQAKQRIYKTPCCFMVIVIQRYLSLICYFLFYHFTSHVITILCCILRYIYMYIYPGILICCLLTYT